MDFTRLIESESAKLKELHAAITRTVVHRDRDERSRHEWQDACTAFHAHVSPLAKLLEPACGQQRYTDPELLEFAIRFLELDPWFFRSGYLKQILITRLKRSDLDDATRQRLRVVLMDAVKRRGTREFKYYCRLAAVLADEAFVGELAAACTGADPARIHRAKMMLEQVRRHSHRHPKRLQPIVHKKRCR
jgi:hypothetical protein